jgi:folate-dependent phosphoribosylglycinamide formyltransferase PurN
MSLAPSPDDDRSLPRREAGASGIVMLAGCSESTNIVYHALKDHVAISRVIVEDAPGRIQFLRNRARTLGWRRVAGQVAFRAGVVPLLERTSRQRITELKTQFGLCETSIPPQFVHRVQSVNAEETLALLRQFAPRVVVVNGTRIIGRRLLQMVDATFINMHAGITPAYRGVHGAYWALVSGDAARCGVTVHVVDAGIDTGPIVEQATFAAGPADTFVTYPYHQLHAGLPLLVRAVTDALAGQLRLRDGPSGPSALWSHPTIGQYVINRAVRGVK